MKGGLEVGMAAMWGEAIAAGGLFLVACVAGAVAAQTSLPSMGPVRYSPSRRLVAALAALLAIASLGALGALIFRV